jgi:HK97 family phage prohead protease
MNDSPNSLIEYKSIEQGLKDVDKSKRIMVGLFAPYKTPDIIGDVAHKGMFDRTWRENKSRVTHLFEHDTLKVIARNPELWEDDNGAYYKSIVPKHKLGDDVLDLATNGLITGHSYAYKTIVGPKNKHGGRDLKEVKHFEVTSTGGAWSVHPNTPLLFASKTLDQADLLEKLETRFKTLDRFCRNSNASDETLEDLEFKRDLLLLEIKQLHQNIIDLSISSTSPADEATNPPKGLKEQDVLMFKAIVANTNIKILN